MVLSWKKLALGSINDWVDLIGHFRSDRSSHQWYLLKSRKYKKRGGVNFTFLGIIIVLKHIIQKTSTWSVKLNL